MPRTATIMTKSLCKFAVLSKYDFVINFRKNLKLKENLKLDFLKKIFGDFCSLKTLTYISKYFFYAQYNKKDVLFK